MIDLNHPTVQKEIRQAALLLMPIYQGPHWKGLRYTNVEDLAKRIRERARSVLGLVERASEEERHGIFASSGGIKVIYWDWEDDSPELEILFDAGSVYEEDLSSETPLYLTAS